MKRTSNSRHGLLRLLALPVAAWLAFANLPAEARDLTAGERTALGDTVKRFNDAMTARNYETIVEVIPPKVMESIAKDAGITQDVLRQAIFDQMKKSLDEVTITSFGMDLAKLEEKELADGTPFVLIPTETVIQIEPEAKVVARSHTLGLLDGTKWYLVRVSEAQQVAMLRKAYPGFADVTFPEATIMPVAE